MRVLTKHDGSDSGFFSKVSARVKTRFMLLAVNLPARCFDQSVDLAWALVVTSMRLIWSEFNFKAASNDETFSSMVLPEMSRFWAMSVTLGGWGSVGGFGEGMLSYSCRKRQSGARRLTIATRSLVTFLVLLYWALLADIGENEELSWRTDVWWSSSPSENVGVSCKYYSDGLVQERHISIANALDICLSCTNLSILHITF